MKQNLFKNLNIIYLLVSFLSFLIYNVCTSAFFLGAYINYAFPIALLNYILIYIYFISLIILTLLLLLNKYINKKIILVITLLSLTTLIFLIPYFIYLFYDMFNIDDNIIEFIISFIFLHICIISTILLFLNNLNFYLAINKEDNVEINSKIAVEKITTLKQLYDNGIITKEEFEEKRKQYIKQL